MTQEYTLRVFQPQSGARRIDFPHLERDAPTLTTLTTNPTTLTRARECDDDVANGDFRASGDATNRTRVRVETIDDDDDVQVRAVDD